MKVLVLNGSPRKESNTLILTKTFLEGLTQNGKYDVEILNIIEKNIKYCLGDLSCWIRQDGHCIIDDDMNEILDKIAVSDVLIWSFPLYEYGMPAPLKNLIDRTNPFLKMEMYSTENRVLHETVVDMTKKKNIIICGCGFPYFEDNFMGLRYQLKNIFIEPTVMCIYESGLISVPEPQLEPVKEKLLKALKQAGIEYDKEGKISKELLEEIEQPMLPNEVYISLINSLVKK